MIIQIQFPDALAPRIVDALTGNFGYQAKIGQNGTTVLIDNPETRPQFSRRMIQRWILQQIAMFESQQAAAASAKQASDKVTADFGAMTVI